MKFTCCISLTLVLILCSILDEGYAEPSEFQQKIFKAQQAEARRNHEKYEVKTINQVYPSFLLNENFQKFVLPELSEDDKLEQTFNQDGKFFLVCRKKTEPSRRNPPSPMQRGAKTTLGKDRSKQFYYEPWERKNRRRDGAFELIQTPLAIEEIKKIKDWQMCGARPIPGLKLITHLSSLASKKFTYSYGICFYFEYGIQTIKPETNLSDSISDDVIDKAWATLFNVCLDNVNMVTALTKHIIYSDHLTDRKLNPNVTVGAEEEKSFVDKQMDKFYDLRNQKESFKTGGTEDEKKEFDVESNYLVRAKLVPDHDTLYESWQYATRNYVNYAPQWRSVNLGQWLKVELDIRNMAWKLKKNVTVHTGVYYGKNPTRLIPPPKVNPKDPEIPPLPIPSLFFKYVHSDNAGIVIITANGVSGSIDDIKCTDVCTLYEWMYNYEEYEHRNVKDKGITKCCTPHDFFKGIEIRGDHFKTIENRSDLVQELKGEKKKKIKQILTFGGTEIEPKTPNATQEESYEKAGADGDTFFQPTRGRGVETHRTLKNTFIIGLPTPVEPAAQLVIARKRGIQ